MKKLVFIFVLGLSVLSVYAQEDTTTYYKKPEPKVDPVRELTFAERLYSGGNLSGMFGNNGSYFDISPVLGYNITTNWSVGIGATYKYYSAYNSYYGVNFKTSVWGGSLFTRLLVGDWFLVQAELEELNTDAYDNLHRKFIRKFISVASIGAGYRSQMGENSYSFVLIAYDFINDLDSPYPFSPILLKVGMAFPIKSR